MDTNKKLQCVLLIDDDEVTNFLNRKVIEHSKIAEHIEVKLNGKEALDYLTGKDTFSTIPCLILLDINMPVMDGWEFLKVCEEKYLHQNKKPNIVMLSTSSDPDDIKRAEGLPLVRAFKSKPLTTAVLDEIVTNFF